ncbi:hypothetical protein PAXRUDRAFT_15645 [Paxillus rubicundulus Ve08.2h10]|uniref:Uncharacterized protein n=1 Tax=Paxillus rubicundulus Ve08.2h10 TaxID=930991 RepID=A0A0D0CD68_9AGAM|nr:hypothetical protein PAXRUDRAFT_15645 [Paxillus rubicundulus Ve08.2h10]
MLHFNTYKSTPHPLKFFAAIKNANSHPGEVILLAKQKQCSKAQKAAAVQGLEQLAGIQMRMAAEEMQAATPRPKGVCPRPQPVKKMALVDEEDGPSAIPAGQEAASVEDNRDTADAEGDLEMQSNEDTGVQNRTKPKKGKAEKPSLKVSIEQTVGRLTAAAVQPVSPFGGITHVGDQKGKVNIVLSQFDI